MPAVIEDEYYSVGGNRHSAAADWSPASGLLAFGADHNVGIWSPSSESRHGISSLLAGHAGKVTAIKFLSRAQDSDSAGELLIAGCANGEVSLWGEDPVGRQWRLLRKVSAHEGTVNAIAITTLDNSNVFVTGGADGKVKLWRACDERIEKLATLELKPRFIPLTLALGPLATGSTDVASTFLIAGGTRNDIQVYSVEDVLSNPRFKLSATLTGHEAWIRSLALTPNSDGGFLLASASQDKYIRIWHFRSDNASSSGNATSANAVMTGRGTLTAKVQTVSAAGIKYSITFEALLLGHEDWIYSASWSPKASNPQLLTASADGSLSIWEADPVSGIWISISRLGEISGQKGATTATGSAGGFWIGLWSPEGKMVTCLGRTGSWRLWQFDEASQFWTQRHAISGHINSVNGICWAPDGSYLLSTSSDQTTRLHAEWKRGEKRSWHEFSRPQIHGYDLNCIASTNSHQFSSGADEKLLRVFNQPKDVAHMLHRLCQIPLPSELTQMPETAAIPVLGLSNKAMDDREEATEGDLAEELDPNTTGSDASLTDIQEPPTEDLLSRHTLWPEHEKLYGHGSEISEAATPIGGDVLATACKASSTEQAVIRLYDAKKDWNEIKPALTAHTLTVTRLAFSSQFPEYLLSVGRDRQWAVFRRVTASRGGDVDDDWKTWDRVSANAKAHSRMILDAAWLANAQHPTFVTGGRDKVVKIWSRDHEQSEFMHRASIARKAPVTAVSVTSQGACAVLAVGEDDGTVSVHVIEPRGEFSVVQSTEVAKHLCPSKTVTRLAWRPGVAGDTAERAGHQLAVASADGSVRIMKVTLDETKEASNE